MISLAELAARIRASFKSRNLDRDFEQEFQAHLAMLREENMRSGMTAGQADRAARLKLGGFTQLRESHREIRSLPLLETCLLDFRYAVRSLRKTPGFAAVVVITLALGIGVNAAIFSIVEAALLRPLPFPNPSRLVTIESVRVSPEPGISGIVSPADFRDWSEQTTTFERVGAHTAADWTLREDDQVETVPAARVTENFFDVLGVQPILGRVFRPDEFARNGPRAVVLSHRLWARRFGGDPSIIGRRLSTGDTVIGVMPADFKFPSAAQSWEPFRDTPEWNFRSARYLRPIGRLRAEQSLETARSEMKSISDRLAAAYPADNKGWGVRLTPLAESLARSYRPALLILMGAAGVMLLIACANISGLILARSASRRRETTVRLALGASRSRLILQCIAEGLLLSSLGAAAGLVLSKWSVGFIFRLVPNTTWTGLVSVREDVHLNGAVVLFTAVVSIFTGVVLVLIPAFSSVRLKTATFLRTVAPQALTRDDNRIHKLLVVLEFACTVVLLAAAGLLIQSFIRMQRLDYGYDPRGMAIMSLPQPAENRQLFTDQVMERIKATPGIESAAIVSSPSFGGLNFPFNIEGEALPAGDAPGRYSSVSTGYFRTIKARWIAGREFDERDSANAPAVAVVNETLATQFFRGANPIGRKIVIAYANQRIPREIIGVVGDIRQDGPRESVKPEVFVHWPQQPWIRANLLIRTNQDPSGVANAVQQSISTVDKTLPRSTFQTVEAMLGDRVAEPRLYMILFGAFAAVSVSLAIIGIYGLLSYIVNLRMYEMSIRIAIGARTPEIIRSVVGEGLRLSIAGIAFGLIGAVALTRLMRNLLFGVMPADPLTLSIVTLLLAFVALTACYIPARRAAKADPMAALRQE